MADWPRLVDAMWGEYSERRGELTSAPETLYIGGGTPSLMPSDLFRRLIDLFEISPSEFTIEANPDDVCAEKADAWLSAGVNRVSLGVQTFDDELLKSIGRRHDAATALRAYDILRERFDNVSIDLMFGLPGQTLSQWRQTVERAIAMRPEHISAYSLMYEEKTALTALRDAGRIKEADEELSLEMFSSLSRMLKEAGYEQYEISNYSLPGSRSRHNSAYWTGEEYLGIGPSAHSYDGDRVRRSNRPDLHRWLERFSTDGHAPQQKPFYDEELLSDEELQEERVMLGLRMKEGIDLKRFKADFGEMQTKSLLARASKWIEAGLLDQSDGHIALTEKGIMQSDTVMAELI